MKILDKVHRNPHLRLLLKRREDEKRKRIHDRYVRSSDSWYLKTLKGIYTGERCFIIGNGPSLRAEDLDRLIGSHTFAANRIFEIFDKTQWRPTNYLIVDIDALHEFYSILGKYDLGHIFLRLDVKDKYDEKKRMDYPITKMTRIILDAETYFDINRNSWNNQMPYISVDVSDHFCDGYTVTFESIQLAIYMGFTEIYLLGVDFNYSVMIDEEGNVHKDETIEDYFTGRRYNTTAFNYNSMLHAYQVAREYCDNHGIVIRNATRGGKLEVFERIEFEKLFTGGYKLSSWCHDLPNSSFREVA